MPSGIAKWVYRHSSQEVCPWNQRFSRELAEDSPFKPREFLRGKDARALARDLLAMSQEEFSVAFRTSPMKRARLQGLKRNAAVVLGNVARSEDADVLSAASDGDEPLVREHANRGLTQVAARVWRRR